MGKHSIKRSRVLGARPRRSAISAGGSLALIVAGIAVPSLAQAGDENDHPVDKAEQTSGVTGQAHGDWGEVARNLAQLDTTVEGGTGGAMGQHSRSTKAADEHACNSAGPLSQLLNPVNGRSVTDGSAPDRSVELLSGTTTCAGN